MTWNTIATAKPSLLVDVVESDVFRSDGSGTRPGERGLPTEGESAHRKESTHHLILPDRAEGRRSTAAQTSRWSDAVLAAGLLDRPRGTAAGFFRQPGEPFAGGAIGEQLVEGH